MNIRPSWLPPIRDIIWQILIGLVATIVGAFIIAEHDALGYDIGLVSLSVWLLILYAVLLMVAIIAGIMQHLYRRRVEDELKQKRDLERQSHLDAQLISMDDTLHRLLPSMLTTSDLNQSVENVLRIMLKDITLLFPNKVFRAYVLRLDDTGVKLIPWVGYQMSHETMIRAEFHVGGGENPRMGEAGYAFIHKEIRVVHKQPDEKMDSRNYIEFDQSGRIIPYQSFACVPMFDINDDCAGILCLDSSTDGSVFDPGEIRDLLISLAARLSVVSVMYDHIQAAQQMRPM